VADDASTRTSEADAVATSARAGEPDRYLAALLAPPPAREGLLALAAFSAELARVPFAASREPTMGEIRLQWWRDILKAPRSAAPAGAPIADALRTAAARHDLPGALLLEPIEARSFDLSGEVMADEAALRDYLWKSEGVLFALAARLLSRQLAEDAQPAAAACGYAYGLTRLLLGLPQTLAHGRLPLPQALLDASGTTRQALLAGESGDKGSTLVARVCEEARRALVTGRQHVAKLPRGLRVAFLPLALVEPYLRAVKRLDRDPLRSPAEILPLTRACRIVTAHWFGRM
jgi:phytoene synthase